MNIYLPFYLFVLALLIAYLETQIEGKNGWASKLPTWRFPKIGLSEEVKNFFMYRHTHRGKQITGYHISMFTILIVVFLLPFFFNYPFTLPNILLQWSIYFLFVITWDFLWFVINPYYSLEKFTREEVWWHESWIGRVPVLYIVGFVISFILIVPYAVYAGDATLFLVWLWNVCVFALCSVCTVITQSFLKENK